MKFSIFIFLSIVSVFSLNANDIDTLQIDSKISDVTVFFDGAQITRTAELKANKGKYLVQFKNLPLDINTQSIQVKGARGCTILSVKHDREIESNKPVNDESIDTQIKTLSVRARTIRNELEVFGIEEQLILQNQSKLGTQENVISVSEVKQAADFYRQRLNEIRSAKLKLEIESNEIKKQLTELQTKRNKNLKITSKTYGKIEVVLELDNFIDDEIYLSYYLTAAGWTPNYDFRVEDISKPLSITYNSNVFQTTGEDWENVNITLSTNNPALKGEKPQLDTWYLDRKTIQSIDRSKQNNQSSNYNSYTPQYNYRAGQPCSISGRVVDNDTGEGLPFCNVYVDVQGTPRGTQTDFDGLFTIKPVPPGNYNLISDYIGYERSTTRINLNTNYEAKINIAMQESSVSLDEVVVTSAGRANNNAEMVIDGMSIENIAPGGYSKSSKRKQSARTTTTYIANTASQNVTNIEYKIKVPYTIPSDGKDYLLKIKEVQLPVEYVYYAVPKLEKIAFLTAKVADWSSLNLLAGSSNIYYRGTFVGEAFIDDNYTEDTLDISLGRDRNVVVQREGKKSVYEKRFIGNNIKETVGWDITIRNNSRNKIKMVVEDQYPLAENKAIEIDVSEKPKAEKNKKLGKLVWTIELAPNEKKLIENTYCVKYPKDVRVYLN